MLKNLHGNTKKGMMMLDRKLRVLIKTLEAEAQRHEGLIRISDGKLKQDHEEIARALRDAAAIIEMCRHE